MKSTIQTVKYQSDIETPNTYTGYLINGKTFILIDGKHRFNFAVNEWIAEGNTPEAAYTQQEISTAAQTKAFTDGTNLISATIQAEVTAYNVDQGIALASVHNAESYSRVTGYTHKNFCTAVWVWSVELWEHMRAWQSTLTGLPTEAEVVAKIAEKPFTFTY